MPKQNPVLKKKNTREQCEAIWKQSSPMKINMWTSAEMCIIVLFDTDVHLILV
jgi:hypothetical protein